MKSMVTERENTLLAETLRAAFPKVPSTTLIPQDASQRAKGFKVREVWEI